MDTLFTILIVSLVITQSVEVIKKFLAWFKVTAMRVRDKEFLDIQYGILFATFFGILSGFLLDIGAVEILLEVFKVEYDLPQVFHTLDVIYMGILLTAGSGFIIDLLVKIKEVLLSAGNINNKNK